MTLKTIRPKDAAGLIEKGALLVDIREADEHARERIANAHHAALSVIGKSAPSLGEGRPVIFHCKSGSRTAVNAERLAASVPGCDVYTLEGGIEGWKAAGLPVARDRSQPLEIMRQVQIAAGGLVLLGVILGASITPAFYGIAAFVGLGLVFAGISGTCMMASLLSVMPWNRRPASR